MSILKKTIAGALTIALSVGAIGTSTMPVLAASENNIEYSRAVTPQIRQAGNRLSGLAETAYASLLA